MADSLFFYDLETSGLDPRQARIMQFAGQRTDLNLKPIGEPFNMLVKLSRDVLPSPEAIILTGITPQMTLVDGVSEAEFTKIFNREISTIGTTFIGYNNVRFDDEFIRYTNYRNFFEPYEWHYKDGRKRWDLLDVVRMSRALRPEGINWPVDKDKLPINRLTDITSANGINHEGAHDALADVTALIEVAKLIKSKQSKLFDYLHGVMTNKSEVEKLLKTNQPVIYTFGAYSGHPQKTTAVVYLADLEDGGILTYDLRQDPNLFTKLSKDKLRIIINREDETTVSPFFVIKANKCPAVAPISVLNDSSEISIGLDKTTINKHFDDFKQTKHALSSEVTNIFDDIYSSKSFESISVDTQLYDKFFDKADTNKLVEISDADPKTLNGSKQIFNDQRLNKLVFLYKARNYPKLLDSDEVVEFEQYLQKILFDGGASSRFNKFMNELMNLNSKDKLTSSQQYIVEELKLYAESIIPSEI
ncbi:MAG TPA: exodeoxyribonuclease I [Candidatus Saccharimonadales bacterium]|nr:exodeoxyribonuclease I [Candidatus Saccharimonadales bacterium]